MKKNNFLSKELSYFLSYSLNFRNSSLILIILSSIFFVIFDYGLLGVLYLSSNQDNLFYNYINKYVLLNSTNLSYMLIIITAMRFLLFINIHYLSREYLKKFHVWFVEDLVKVLVSSKQKFVEKIDQGILKNVLSFQINQLNQTVYFPILKLTVEVLQLLFLMIIVIYFTFSYLWVLVIIILILGLLLIPLKRMINRFGIISYKSQEQIFNFSEVFVDKRHEFFHLGNLFEQKKFSEYLKGQQYAYNAIQLTNSFFKPTFELFIYLIAFTLVLGESIVFIDALFILFLALKTFPVLNIYFNLINAINSNLPVLKDIFLIHNLPKKKNNSTLTTNKLENFQIIFKEQNFSLGKKSIYFPNCKIKSGNTTLIRGVSGRGKTVLMKLFLNYFDNKSIQVKGKYSIDQLIDRTIFINTTPYHLNIPVNQILNKDDDFLDYLFKKQELNEIFNQKFEELSYGQKKRVIFTSTLNYNNDLILLDEPTNGLDSKNIDNFYLVINKLREASKTIVIASHDESLKSIADEIIEL
jgi:ABC-type Mn2+/Zn2+ transport system ATPase subunit